MEFILRRATRGDAGRIRWLIHMVRINPTNLDWRRFMILEAPNGRLVGCAQVKRHTDGSRELASLAIVPRYRRAGAAARLIDHFLGRTPRPLYLMCRPELESFYERFAFRRVAGGELPRYFRRIRAVSAVMSRLVRQPAPLIMRVDREVR